jgi:hypothetical protein
MMCFGCRLPIVTAEAPLVSGGWRIATGFAASNGPGTSSNFYAVFTGDDFGHPERGIIAVMARAHPPAGVPNAGHAAQLAVHSLAEGYFGAQRTLSARRAAGIAFTAINRWLFGQSSAALAPVSMTALMFQHESIAVAHIGTCQLYRYRDGVLSPMLREHARHAADGNLVPARAVGLDLEITVDYAEEKAEPADRYVLLAGLERHHPETVYARLAEQLRAPAELDAFAAALLPGLGQMADDFSAVVLDVLATPGGEAASIADFADLPLRPAPREGDSWDGFVLGKTLYRGRYTMLKAAFDSIEQREVALKIPLPSMLQDEVFAAGFMREAWIGTTVRRASVARYLELAPGRRSSLYLVMPLYKGETLEARLNRAPLVSLPEGVGITLKLCEAVQDLASIQIVHRDIKPDNVMLLAGNEVRLLDLGLAYLPGIDMEDAVKPGGTLRYMAPELLQGTAANARTEVYALGVTIYRMFGGGVFPFGQREARPLARVRPDLPDWLGEALARALNPKPAERFADAGELAQALQMGLAHGPEHATRPRRRWPLTELQMWQAAALIFAAGFLFLLLRGMK